MTNTGLDYGNFKNSLKNLETQYEHLLNLSSEHPAYIREGMTESVIQRFETCYDSLWKALRRYLIEALGNPDVPNSPRPLFRMADENRLLASGGAQWEAYVQARIDTTHDYDQGKANRAVAIVPDFISDAISLYCAMTGESWA